MHRSLAPCVALAGLIALALAPSATSAQDHWSAPFGGVRRLHRRTGNQDVQVLVVDLCAAGVSVRATGSGERRRTPSSFGALVGAQAAVNGDFFSFSTYSTDGVSMSGGAAWGGADHTYVAPVAFGDHRVAMPVHEGGSAPEPWMREVVSGHPTILSHGGVRDNSGDPLCTNRHPRTALGLSADRRTLFVAVVDGRSSSRIGMTCTEVAVMLRDLGASDVTNMDGGGSSAMWIAGAGVVSHPSDGAERVVGNHFAIRASGHGPAAHCPNLAPEGSLDSATCEGIGGWTRDPDERAVSIDAHVYVGGPAGGPHAVGYPLHADVARDDLCAALGHCRHAFTLRVPHGFMDGVERRVFAYGIDTAGGDNTLLAGAPRILRCDRPELPYATTTGVRRHVGSPEIFAAWRFDPHDVIRLEDAALDAYADGEPLPDAPRLVRAEGEPAVFLEDGALWRQVPNSSAMDAWHFRRDRIHAIDAATLGAQAEGEALARRPWLVRGSGPAIYLVDAMPPRLEAPIIRWPGANDGGAPTPAVERPALAVHGGCAVQQGRATLGGVWLALSALILLLRRGARTR